MPEEAGRTAACPWCSEPLSAAGATECPSCGAHLVEETMEDVPGVTAVDPAIARLAAAPRKVKRTFGSLLVGDDDEIPPPTEAEMPALARPDEVVRLEMLRLELEARLAEQRADARMLAADGRAAPPAAAEADPSPGEPSEGTPELPPGEELAPGAELPPGAELAPGAELPPGAELSPGDELRQPDEPPPATEPELEAPAAGSADEHAAS